MREKHGIACDMMHRSNRDKWTRGTPTCPWGDGLDGLALRSSRVILIVKYDGRVLFDGSANDEG